MKPSVTFISLLSAIVLSACGHDPYDTGDGSLSYLRADFVEARTNANSYVVSIETDDGEVLQLTRAVNLDWIERPDTVYRALMYYNKVETQSGTFSAQPVSLAQVLVPPITMAAGMEDSVKTDPVVFETSWTSRNGKYLNIGFYVKIGTVNGSYSAQTIGVVCDSVQTNADGTRNTWLRLYHDQNGVPEYYSSEAYLSIPVSSLPFSPVDGDTVSFVINTYGGTVTRTFDF